MTIKETVIKTFASPKTEYLYHLKQYKDNYLPAEYNQLELLDRLCDPQLDHYMSITTRGDGKSFNYIGCLLYLSYKLDLGICLIVRHWSLQDKMREMVEQIIQTINFVNFNDSYNYRVTSDYITIELNGKDVALICDLNNASDLKQSSAILKNFPVILYDEFLTLTDDYEKNEYDKLRTIYKSIDRVKDRKYIGTPKCIFLGNPVNFDSPILPSLNVYNAMQTQEINTMKQYRNVLLELRRNDARNDGKNTRAFPDEYDADVTGEFEFSNFQLLSEQQYIAFCDKGEQIKIKLPDKLMLTVTKKNSKIALAVERSDNTETYCTELFKEGEDCEYLKPRYYSDNFVKKYQKGLFKYKDSFTKSYINRDDNLMRLNLYKCFSKPKTVTTEETYEAVQRANILKALASKYE